MGSVVAKRGSPDGKCSVEKLDTQKVLQDHGMIIEVPNLHCRAPMGIEECPSLQRSGDRGG